MLAQIEHAVAQGDPITVPQAAFLFERADDHTLSRLATTVRGRFHPPNTATYLIMSIVNTTNVCVAKCDYCAFYKLPGEPGAYTLTTNQICAKIEALQGHGGSLVGFNGGFHPDLRITDYAQLFANLRDRFPTLEFYELTVAEFMFICKVSRVSYERGAQLLAEAGTRWITGGGAEILDDGFRRRHSPLKYTVADYYEAQEAIINASMGSTATMVIGFDETLAERLNHLNTLREFQDRVSGALVSFLCWTFKPQNTDLGGEEVTTREYLRWLAVSRIFLHNITNIRTSVLTRNEDALLGLQFGANDFDLPTEDEVTETAGATISLDFDSILASAQKLGFDTRHRAPWELM